MGRAFGVGGAVQKSMDAEVGSLERLKAVLEASARVA